MAERKLDRSIIERDISKIPRRVLDKLAPFRNSIEGLLRIPLDFPHGPLHLAETRKHARAIIEVLTDDYPYRPHLKPGLGELEKIDQAVTLHDSGYVFSQIGVLPPEEHNIGSWFIAKCLGLSDEVCWGILNHQKDKLYEYHPLWLWAVNAADRAAGMGYSGLLREAYYLGARHPAFDDPFAYKDRLVDIRDNDQIRFKTKWRTEWSFPAHAVEEISWTDYEAKVKAFYKTEILPQMNDKQKKKIKDRFVWVHLPRFDGDDGGTTPILMDAWGALDFKYFNTLEIGGLVRKE